MKNHSSAPGALSRTRGHNSRLHTENTAASLKRFAKRRTIKPVQIYTRATYASHPSDREENAAWAAVIVDGNNIAEMAGTLVAQSPYHANILGAAIVIERLRASKYWPRPLLVLPSDQIVDGVNKWLPKWKIEGFFRETKGFVACEADWKRLDRACVAYGHVQVERLPSSGKGWLKSRRLAKRATDLARAERSLCPKVDWFKVKPRGKPGDCVE